MLRAMALPGEGTSHKSEETQLDKVRQSIRVNMEGVLTRGDSTNLLPTFHQVFKIKALYQGN